MDVPETLPRIRGDRKQLKQAIINLLNNAVKFNKKEGEIILKAASKRKFLEISISDTGLGIPEDERDRVFEKFYRVSNHRGQVPGTGLGLSVVKQIIQGHGGDISLTSDVDIGTTFTVTLPYEVLNADLIQEIPDSFPFIPGCHNPGNLRLLPFWVGFGLQRDSGWNSNPLA